MSYYVTIPMILVKDKNISPNSKILFGIVANLSNERGYCWASNKYIGEILDIHEISVSRMLKELIDCGYIIRFEEVVDDRLERRLKLSENAKEALTKTLSPPKQNCLPPLNKNVKHNNKENNKENNQEEYIGVSPFVDDKSNEAWGRWVKYRKEIRKPLSPSTTKSQIAKLNAQAPHTRAEIIDRSIENGWQGLFELPKPKKSGMSEDEFLKQLDALNKPNV
jgi:DNA-binding MarR family transcriptional regulator